MRIFVAKATKLYITHTSALCVVKIFKSVKFHLLSGNPWRSRTVGDGKLIGIELSTMGGDVCLPVWVQWV